MQFVKKGNVYERLPEFLNKQEKRTRNVTIKAYNFCKNKKSILEYTEQS